MASNELLYFSVKNLVKMKNSIWRKNSNIKQTADKCKQTAEIVNKQLKL